MTETTTDFTPTADLLEQENSLRLAAVDELACHRIGRFIADRSISDGLPVTTGVFLGDRLVYKAAFADTTAMNDIAVEAKRRTALIGGHASLFERNRHLEAGTTFEEATGLSFPEHAPFGGAVPLKDGEGELRGMVVVSGLTQEEDHDLAVEAIRSLGDL